MQRVSEGAAAWQVGDLVQFGQLMNASCASSNPSISERPSGDRRAARDYERTPGVYGSRFSGGGYGGCVIGLAEGTQAEAAADEILGRYGQSFPDYARDAAVYWVANGGMA